MINRVTNIGSLEKDIARIEDLMQLKSILSKFAKNVQTELDWVEKNIFDEEQNIETGTTANWGLIGGSINAQGDLISLLNGKSDTTHNHDSEYASITHNHNSDYAPIVHTHASQIRAGKININAGTQAITYSPAMVGAGIVMSVILKEADGTLYDLLSSVTGEINTQFTITSPIAGELRYYSVEP